MAETKTWEQLDDERIQEAMLKNEGGMFQPGAGWIGANPAVTRGLDLSTYFARPKPNAAQQDWLKQAGTTANQWYASKPYGQAIPSHPGLFERTFGNAWTNEWDATKGPVPAGWPAGNQGVKINLPFGLGSTFLGNPDNPGAVNERMREIAANRPEPQSVVDVLLKRGGEASPLPWPARGRGEVSGQPVRTAPYDPYANWAVAGVPAPAPAPPTPDGYARIPRGELETARPMAAAPPAGAALPSWLESPGLALNPAAKQRIQARLDAGGWARLTPVQQRAAMGLGFHAPQATVPPPTGQPRPPQWPGGPPGPVIPPQTGQPVTPPSTGGVTTPGIPGPQYGGGWGAGGGAGGVGGSTAAQPTSNIIDRLLATSGTLTTALEKPVDELEAERRARGLYEQDIGYLRGAPFTSTQEQAMRAQAQEAIRNTYAIQRQQIIDQVGANSGALGPWLERVNQEEAAALNAVDRELMVKGVDEYRSRLAESRGLADVMASQERGREMLHLERLGASQNVLSGLEALQRARQMEAFGIQQALDEADFRNLIALVQFLQGNAPDVGQIGSISNNILSYAMAMLQSAQGQQNANAQGLGSLLNLYYLTRPSSTPTGGEAKSPR